MVVMRISPEEHKALGSLCRTPAIWIIEVSSGEEVVKYKTMIHLQHASAFGMGGIAIALEATSQIETTLPSFQAAFIDERNEIRRIVDEPKG